MSGELKKLIIEAYKDPKFQNKDSISYTALFNPATYKIKYEVEISKAQGIGTSDSAQKFQKIKPQDLSLEFIVDGTGVSGSKEDVEKQVTNFLKTTYEYKGDEHRPRFVKLVWGALLFKGLLKSADVSYTLFKPDGSPLRAKISAAFTGFIEDEKRAAKEKNNSPDLTHYRTVKEGDTLPLMAYEIYKDPKYYLQVAKVNQLKNFRNLTVGEQLFFPPISTKT